MRATVSTPCCLTFNWGSRVGVYSVQGLLAVGDASDSWGSGTPSSPPLIAK